ncbi:NAD(P)/FAD-dependent oxidoreductase [Umezawaea sp. Da 62-37]|uniref:NAD(P)/FAD-dependent oxidoreductase n=1 Tax=Umezawaea sp. Da 62-37 TaxID=3075927 RepID=UPI0028F72B79|nr:NAD(P)/FAD-dependent oxidoreductase [Umezawaea sp. Da 62-37]WNV89591.1 NAD(P)/FAD-dependent oxidoreductase [Umezawaea sp. Da 62-37]
MSSPSAEYDAIVIGGGPAGSASAWTLAGRGHSVLVLDRQSFPRFHIGESMLTYAAALFERLGLGDRLRAEFPVKTGAEFCDTDGKVTRVDFADQGGGRVETTFQVERADFDQLLLDNAIKAGAEVVHEAKVTKVLVEDGRVAGVEVTIGETSHTVRAKQVVDASGRAGVIANQHFKSRRISERLRMLAVFKHYDGVEETTNPGVEGDIVIGSHTEGWVWSIPIRPGKLSVGTVSSPAVYQRVGDPEKVFTDHVDRIPRIRQRIASATAVTELKSESDYSYHTEDLAGPGFFVAGDAGCFVDPIFSAGVYLATSSGLRAGELAASALEGELSEEEAVDRYTRFYKTGYDCYFRLIYAFYEHDFKIGSFLKSTGVWVDPRWVARLLGGDFWSEKNALANHLRSISDFDTFDSFEPLYGCPVYPEIDATEEKGMVLGIG